jgi:hypothetical protein
VSLDRGGYLKVHCVKVVQSVHSQKSHLFL